MSTALVERKMETHMAFAERQPRVRLTHRGRLLLLVSLVGLALAVLMLVGTPAAESTGAAHHAPAVTVVVEPGQTLWDIASDVAPHEDPRAVIAKIIDLNALSDAGSIRAGQPLYVPTP